METRKVQITGGSTFVISLPKQWINDVGVQKNDTLGFIPQHDGTLLITPKIVKGREERIKKFTYSKTDDNDKILRDLIGAYMMGYDVIDIFYKPRMPNEVRATIRTFTQMVIGPEIVDESLNMVKTKDLLDPSDLSFNSSIRRMHRIVEEMHKNAMLAVSEGNNKLAKDVIDRDGEVDRLNWLVARQYNMIIRDIRLAQSMDTTRERAINFLLIARIIERIGDHGTKIAENVGNLTGGKGSANIYKEMNTLSQRALGLLSESITSLFRKNMTGANDSINNGNSLIDDCDKLSNKLSSVKGENALALGTILESIKRVGSYSRDVSECVINYLVDLQED